MPNLFMLDLLGTTVSADEETILKHSNLGAIILFTRNFANPVQFIELIKAIRSIRPDIFIAVDHEGGIVQRFQRHGFRSLPAARVYGDVFDINHHAGLALAEQYGEIMAKDLLSYGIDLSLAPVLDIHNSSDVISKLDRAFHQDPEIIIKLASAFIRGMKKAGMPAVGKHFPGHGSVSADSHTSMPLSSDSETLLRERDLKPFTQLIANNVLDGIMPAHVTYSSVDPLRPAGFSNIWLQQILRSQFKFSGLVISDCLSMVGADIGNLQERANEALQAGCDILTVCNQPRELLLDLLNTVDNKSDLASLKRINKFKEKMIHCTKKNHAIEMSPYFSLTDDKLFDYSSPKGTEVYNKTTSV